MNFKISSLQLPEYITPVVCFTGYVLVFA